MLLFSHEKIVSLLLSLGIVHTIFSKAYAFTKVCDIHGTVLGDTKRYELAILFLGAENLDGEKEYIIVQVS